MGEQSKNIWFEDEPMKPSSGANSSFITVGGVPVEYPFTEQTFQGSTNQTFQELVSQLTEEGEQ